MSNTADIFIRSIPMDTDGTPLDKSLRMASRLDEMPQPAAQVPAAVVPDDKPFDPTEFARNLPKPETARLASMAEATAGSQGVKVAEKSKPQVHYRGRNLAPVEYELDMPFTIEGVDYDVVTLTSPRGDLYDEFQQIVVTHGGETAVLWLVLTGTSGMSADAVEAIHQFDVVELNKLILPFLPRLMRSSIEAALQEDRAKTEASSTTQAPAQE